MHGKVSFLEMGTSDEGRSRLFFERVFGWTFNPMTPGGGWFQTPSMRVGFHTEDTPQMYVFFQVPDLEQAVALVREAGGEADPPGPWKSGFGRFSFCRDPQGMRFGLHQESLE
jgi:predicted enzyme related to lactoylglutathione lyase